MKRKHTGFDTMVPRFIRRAVHKLRAGLKAWSPEKDREHFETVFLGQDYYPFDFSYPGYITILRFADLAAPHIKNLSTVLDLGCGPGEITCELARRFPEVRFVGIDHSPAGIKRANQNARSLNLQNTTFQVSDMGEFSPDCPIDLITMFDAFHHLSDPGLFLKRMKEISPRFLLVEPRGDWKGSWRRDLDFDWLIMEMEKVRARLAYSLGEKESPPPAPPPGSSSPNQTEAAVENRYALTDFPRMFSGFGLTVRGTVSGLDKYPPGSRIRSGSRSRFNKFAYELYAEIDEWLRESKLDLLAKHWVIYAEKGMTAEAIEVPLRLPTTSWTPPVQGAHDAEYLYYEGPNKITAGAAVRAKIRLRNRSFRTWTSKHPEKPDFLGYHWLDKRGTVVVWDGERTALPRDIGPGEECELMLRLRAPDASGRYILALDMVQEGAAWSSDAGVPWLRIPVRVKKAKLTGKNSIS